MNTNQAKHHKIDRQKLKLEIGKFSHTMVLYIRLPRK